MGFSEMEMEMGSSEMEMEMGCKRHPNEIQQPGICSSCLRENLALVSSSSANFYASKNTNNTVFCSSYSSASYSSVSSSPSTPRRLHGGGHRRNGSDVLLKTGPSMADAAVNRIAQGTKVHTEGGYEKIFRQTFETVSEEKLLNTYACYLSTSAGPVMGVLYVSTLKLAFCSDNPLSYKDGDLTKWSYYKVVMPFYQLKAVNPSTSIVNPAEKYIQVISIDNHEFWFMRFVLYDNAVKTLQEAMQNRG